MALAGTSVFPVQRYPASSGLPARYPHATRTFRRTFWARWCEVRVRLACQQRAVGDKLVPNQCSSPREGLPANLPPLLA